MRDYDLIGFSFLNVKKTYPYTLDTGALPKRRHCQACDLFCKRIINLLDALTTGRQILDKLRLRIGDIKQTIQNRSEISATVRRAKKHNGNSVLDDIFVLFDVVGYYNCLHSANEN